MVLGTVLQRNGDRGRGHVLALWALLDTAELLLLVPALIAVFLSRSREQKLVSVLAAV